MSNFKTAALAAAFAFGMTGTAMAAGDLATQPQRLAPLELGMDPAGFSMSETDYTLETGKAYRLRIVSSGNKEYAFVAPGFFANVWLRKIEVSKVEIKVPTITELEFERPGEAEIFFVPIRPGEYEFRMKGLEAQGMVGRFIVQ